MLIYKLDIVLNEPALLTQPGGEPNSAISYLFIPGSVIRGACIAKHIEAHPTLRDPAKFAADAYTTKLFFSGGVRFLNAYPLLTSRSVPVPSSWHQSKAAKRRATHTHQAAIVDLLVDGGAEGGADEIPDWKAVSQGDKFYAYANDGVQIGAPGRQVAIHTQRDREAGRATRDDGAVYRYEALRPGQTFRAYILIEPEVAEEDASKLRALLAGVSMHFGGARTAGYGKVSVVIDALAHNESWSETDLLLPQPDPQKSIAITLLSDVLVTSADGNPTSSALITALTHALQDVADVLISPAFVATRMVGGFNRVWGLPLPQQMAVRMGTVFVMRVLAFQKHRTAQDLRKRLEAVAWAGIGERREEGFGRLGFAEVPTQRMVHVAPKTVPNDEIAVTSDNASTLLARQFVNGLLRNQLDRQLVIVANQLAAKIRRPSVSQLTRLQAVVRDVLATLNHASSPADVDRANTRLKTYLDNIAARRRVATAFMGNAITDSEDLFAWLKKRFDLRPQGGNATGLFESMGLKIGPPPKLLDVEATLDNLPLAREYNLRLAIEVLGLAAKGIRKADLANFAAQAELDGGNRG